MRSMLEKRLRDIKHSLKRVQPVGKGGEEREAVGEGGRYGVGGPDRFSGSWQPQKRLVNPAANVTRQG